jgi:2-polyprenyl-3-methyl-5-hydroxy-6-metoxy-1,4-benzoquinol methylase
MDAAAKWIELNPNADAEEIEKKQKEFDAILNMMMISTVTKKNKGN